MYPQTVWLATPEVIALLDGLRLGVARIVASPSLLRDAIAPAAPKMAPLYGVGPYGLYPLHVCNKEAIASLFTKICARSNFFRFKDTLLATILPHNSPEVSSERPVPSRA